jgi:uroporphyrinogen-III decarboxylase
MLLALRRETPDRLPATVHQWQDCHLREYLGGINALDAFRRFGLDASIAYMSLIQPDSPDWRCETETIDLGDGREELRRTITTPGGALTQRFERTAITTWVTEHLVKRAEDVELLASYMPVPRLDQDALAREYDRLGDDGIMRGVLIGHQGGCWQDACELFGLQNLILATHRDPDWVHRFLRVLQEWKLRYVAESLPGAKYDLIETGGGASSSTCISPRLFREFCLPYDREQHDALHALGFQVVYHTCGGMMPILELIVENGCDASETLTPAGMGGDARPAEIKERIGADVCLIGGINQREVLDCGDREAVRREVFRLFDELGAGGGYIMSPSDHFFETPVRNLEWYAEAARECRY